MKNYWRPCKIFNFITSIEVEELPVYRFEIQIFSFRDVKFLCQHDFIVMNLSGQLKQKRKENFQIGKISRVP